MYVRYSDSDYNFHLPARTGEITLRKMGNASQPVIYNPQDKENDIHTFFTMCVLCMLGIHLLCLYCILSHTQVQNELWHGTIPANAAFYWYKNCNSSRLPLHFLLIFMTCEYCVSPFKHTCRPQCMSIFKTDSRMMIKAECSEHGLGWGCMCALLTQNDYPFYYMCVWHRNSFYIPQIEAI